MQTEKYSNDNITIYRGDCLEILERLVPDNTASICITDPPYYSRNASQCVGLKSNDLSCTWIDMMNSAVFFKAIYKKIWTRLQTDAFFFSFLSWRSMATISKATIDSGIKIRSMVVWDKAVKGLDMIGYRPTYELVMLTTKGKAKIPDRSITDIKRVPWKATKQSGHSAEKPVELIKWLLETTGQKGIVIDPFLGSGTTAIACRELGLPFIGIELSKKWFDYSCRRVEEHAH